MMVEMDVGRPVVGKTLPAIEGNMQLDSQDINSFLIIGIDANFAVVEGPGTQVVYFAPGLTMIHRTKHPSRIGCFGGFRSLPGVASAGLVCLHDSVDNAWVLPKYGQSATA